MRARCGWIRQRCGESKLVREGAPRLEDGSTDGERSTVVSVGSRGWRSLLAVHLVEPFVVGDNNVSSRAICGAISRMPGDVTCRTMCRQFDSGPRHRALLLGFSSAPSFKWGLAELARFLKKDVTEDANHTVSGIADRLAIGRIIQTDDESFNGVRSHAWRRVVALRAAP